MYTKNTIFSESQRKKMRTFQLYLEVNFEVCSEVFMKQLQIAVYHFLLDEKPISRRVPTYGALRHRGLLAYEKREKTSGFCIRQ